MRIFFCKHFLSFVSNWAQQWGVCSIIGVHSVLVARFGEVARITPIRDFLWVGCLTSCCKWYSSQISASLVPCFSWSSLISPTMKMSFKLVSFACSVDSYEFPICCLSSWFSVYIVPIRILSLPVWTVAQVASRSSIFKCHCSFTAYNYFIYRATPPLPPCLSFLIGGISMSFCVSLSSRHVLDRAACLTPGFQLSIGPSCFLGSGHLDGCTSFCSTGMPSKWTRLMRLSWTCYHYCSSFKSWVLVLLLVSLSVLWSRCNDNVSRN